MKKVVCFLAFFLSYHTLAWSNPKADTIYYLIDTTKVTVNDRMWDIYTHDSYKFHVIQCPCLKLNGKPTFTNETRDRGKIISKTQIKKIKLISLSTLILRSKTLLDNNAPLSTVSFFFIEPYGKNYVVRQEVPMNPEIRIESVPDMMERRPPDTSAFKKPGLITIAAKDIGKYVNKSVITVGSVENTKVEPDNTTLLYIGADYPNQDFIILIESKDRANFDLPDFHYGKRIVKVTGRVFVYKGQFAIAINDENQLNKAPK